jgi:hypothetical protein
MKLPIKRGGLAAPVRVARARPDRFLTDVHFDAAGRHVSILKPCG